MEQVGASVNLTAAPAVFRVRTYALCEELSGIVIGGLLIFGPWAFGSTQTWSIWTLNIGSYFLGLVLLIKLRLRTTRIRPEGQAFLQSPAGCGPARNLGALIGFRGILGSPKSRLWAGQIVRILAVLQGVLLVYITVSAANARATFDSVFGALQYRPCISWLPHSLDASATWEMFWRSLGLICFFWAVRDWLKAFPLCRFVQAAPRAPTNPGLLRFPSRLAAMLTLLTASGGLLALEGILQRLVGSPLLLFVVLPEIHQDPFTQFASFAYRANAAQYFNLLWPVSFLLGLGWFGFPGERGRGGIPLGFCAIAMAAASMISGARAAALVTMAMVLLLVSLWLLRREARGNYRIPPANRTTGILFAALIVFIAISSILAWRQIRPRMIGWKEDLQARQQLYERAELIARDYPLFGTGAGTFERVYGFYRTSPGDEWPAQLHNDWLETRLTFGWLGTTLIAVAFGLISVRGFLLSRQPIRSPLLLACGLVLAGCLIQARWDFPLQISSIVFLFTFWCAVILSFDRALAPVPERFA